MSDYMLFATLSNLGYGPLAVSRAIHALTGRHDEPDQPDDGPDYDGPGWDDSSAWELGPDPAEGYDPSEEDEDWLAGLDVEEAARYSAWYDHMEGLARVTDADISRVNSAG